MRATIPFRGADYGVGRTDGVGHGMVTKCYWLSAQLFLFGPADLKTIRLPIRIVAGRHDLEESTAIFRLAPRPEQANLEMREFLNRPCSGALSSGRIKNPIELSS
jgi:hypothetical protein